MIKVKYMPLGVFLFQFKTDRLQFIMGEMKHTTVFAFVYHWKLTELSTGLQKGRNP